MEDPLKDLQKDVAAFLRATAPGVEDPPGRKWGGQPGTRTPASTFYRFG